MGFGNKFLFSLFVTYCYGQTLILYHEAAATEEKFSLSVSNCTESLPELFVKQLVCKNFSVDCAIFYDSKGCRGNALEIRSSLNDSLLPIKLDGIKSIGPCAKGDARAGRQIQISHVESNKSCSEMVANNSMFDNDTKSDTRKVEIETPLFLTGHKMMKIHKEIELFDRKDYKGRQITLALKPGRCVPIPRSMKDHLSSIRVQGGICVELHESSDCLGDFVEIDGDDGEKLMNLDRTVASVTLCSVVEPRCRNLTREDQQSHSDAYDGTSTILYDEDDFKGNWLSLKIGSACVDLPVEWQGAAESIRLTQHCVIVHTGIGCPSNSDKDRLQNPSSIVHNAYKLLHHSVRTNEDKNAKEVYWTGFQLRKWHIDAQIRSIGPCEEDMPSKSPHISLVLITALFLSGIGIAAVVNRFVAMRARKERKVEMYEEKPFTQTTA